MVAQKPPQQFLGKVNDFFGDPTTPERQRSGVAHFTLSQRSDVA